MKQKSHKAPEGTDHRSLGDGEVGGLEQHPDHAHHQAEGRERDDHEQGASCWTSSGPEAPEGAAHPHTSLHLRGPPTVLPGLSPAPPSCPFSSVVSQGDTKENEKPF